MTNPDWFVRSGLVAAGILGAGGIAAAAAASHAGNEAILGPLSLVALTQAPAIVALVHLATGRLMKAATVFIALGALGFVADLGIRHWLGASPMSFIAPVSGMAMIVGWALLIPAGITRRW